MKAQQPVPRPARSPWRRVLLAACVLFTLGAMSIALVAFWFVRQLKLLETLAQETSAAYGALNEEFAFALPASAEQPASDRVEAYLRARRAVMDTITPEVEDLAERTLDGPSLRNAQAVKILRNAHDFLKQARDAHLAALRRERMSLDEFLWIHGLAVRTMLDGGGGDSGFQRDVDRTLAGLARLAEGDARAPKPEFSPKAFRDQLEEQYRSFPNLPAESLARFQAGKILGSLIDVAGANRELMRSLDLKSRLGGKRRDGEG